MLVEELAAAIAECGASLRVHDRRLQLRGADRLPDKLRELAQLHKPALLRVLQTPGAPLWTRPLHTCACGKAIPYSWLACTACDPAWRDSAPLQARLGTIYRAVAAAWDGLSPPDRPEAVYQALRALDPSIQDAYSRHDWPALEQAITEYEQTAAPLLAAAQPDKETAA